MKPKISVIIPAFNAERFIGQAIQSLLDQTFSDIEILIINDASSDTTEDVISSFKDKRIRSFTHSVNYGVCNAKNTGLSMARSEWVVFLDADDSFHKERLAILYSAAKSNPLTFIGTNIFLCFSSPEGRLIPWTTFYKYWRIEVDEYYFPRIQDLFHLSLASTFPIIQLDWIRKHNIKFQQEYRGHEWLVFFLHLIHSGLKYLIIGNPLYHYRITSSSFSNRLLDMTTQIKCYKYLESLDWLDEESKKIIIKSKRISNYRCVPASIREKKWRLALSYFIRFPLSIFYLAAQLPRWVKRNYVRLRSAGLVNKQ